MFRYVLGNKVPPAGIMIVGSSSHETFQFFYEHKLETQKEYELSTVTDYFIQNIQERFHADWQHDDRTADLENTGVKTVTLFHEQRGPVIIPQQIEKKVSRTLTHMGVKIRIVGKIDLITGTDIVDHKVTRRKRSQADIFDDIQLGIYNWAENAPEKAIGWDLYLKHKKGGETKIDLEDPRVFCRDQDLARIKDICYQVQRGIQAGVFLPTNPSNYWCNPTYCGFHKICHELYGGE